MCSRWRQQSWGSSPALPAPPASLSRYPLPGTQWEDGVPQCPQTGASLQHGDKGVRLGTQPASLRPATGPLSLGVLGAMGDRGTGMEGEGDKDGG